MPNFVHTQLLNYRHNAPKQLQHCLYEPAAIRYERQPQETSFKVEGNILDREKKLCVQQVVFSFRYYARAVNVTILHILNSRVADFLKAIELTMEKCWAASLLYEH